MNAFLSKLEDEETRLLSLEKTGLLDSVEEDPFEIVVDLVRQVLNAPMSAVSLVDKDRQWFKAERGLGQRQTPRNVSFCSYAIRSYDPYIIEDARSHPLFRDNPLVLGAPFIGSYAGIPLTTAEGFNLGSLCVLDTRPRIFSEHEISVLTKFAALVMQQIHLREQAATDHLTGVLTRRIWESAARREVLRSRRHGDPIAVICTDIDHFKAVNDRFGHAGGDAVLIATTSILAASIRETDLLGRTGGEEFTILCSGTAIEDAMMLAERCRAALAERPVEWQGKAMPVTASFGVAALRADDALEDMVMRADEALYKAKHAGRNRVVQAED